MRLLENTAGCNAADHASELQWCGGDGALADGHGNRLTRIPFAMKSSFDPFLGGHQARLFGGKVDAGFMAEAQVAAVVGEAIDSHTHAHGVEKDVAGFQNCIVKSHGAMGLRSAFRVVNIAVILATKEGSIA